MSKGPEDILNINKGDAEKKLIAFENRERAKEISDIRELMSTPVGKRVAHRILEKCETFIDAYAGDVNLTHINLGKQKIGHWFLGEMDIAKATAYQEMVREHRSAMVVREQIINNIRSGKDQGDA